MTCSATWAGPEMPDRARQAELGGFDGLFVAELSVPAVVDRARGRSCRR
jgi:alkanesulfonate monooxygenase SsuD/methylene tetrahydromethanopterin reductase-like flavin-dependent oxidoreductase (luciferase family)